MGLFRLQAGFGAIQNLCCVHEDCTEGPPTICNEQCANLVLDFRDRCRSILDTIPDGFTNLDEFTTVCQNTNGPPPLAPSAGSTAGGGSIVHDLTGSLSNPNADHTVLQYSCSYTEVMSIALVTTYSLISVEVF